MNIPDSPLLSMLRDRMSWLEARQNVLSQNVSNANTPNYVPHDLKPMDFESLLHNSSGGFQTDLTTTNSRHIAIAPPEHSEFTDTVAPDTQATPNGNSVSLEQEMIKVSDTQVQFQAATNLYAKAISLMRTALGKATS